MRGHMRGLFLASRERETEMSKDECARCVCVCVCACVCCACTCVYTIPSRYGLKGMGTMTGITVCLYTRSPCGEGRNGTEGKRRMPTCYSTIVEQKHVTQLLITHNLASLAAGGGKRKERRPQPQKSSWWGWRQRGAGKWSCTTGRRWWSKFARKKTCERAQWWVCFIYQLYLEDSSISRRDPFILAK